MARTENLEEFLTDVADAIKTKKGTTDKIPAANFDTEIASIETGIDTSDATATTSDIASGKTAYVKGEKVTGEVREVENNSIITGGKFVENTPYNGVTTDYDLLLRAGGAIQLEDNVIATRGDITPDKIVKGNTIFGIEGTAETGTGGKGDIKLFKTVEEMQADPDVKEGDLAVVYRSTIKSVSNGDTVTSITFPRTVVFTEAITSSYYGRLRHDSEPMIYLNMQLDASAFWLRDMYGTIQAIEYSSTDGITYTRIDSNEDTYEIGKTTISNLDEHICKFIQTSGMNFGGMYEYTLNADTNTIQLYDLSTATISYSSSGSTTNSLVFNDKLPDIYSIEKLNSVVHTYNYAVLYLSTDNKLKLVCSNVTYDRILVNNNNKVIGLGSIVSTSEDTIIYDLDYTTLKLSNPISIKSTSFNDGRYIELSNIKSIPLPLGNAGYNYSLGMCQLNQTMWNWSKSFNLHVYNDMYIFAPTQLTLKFSDELLPGKIAYGKNGVVEGDESIYDNLSFTALQKAVNNTSSIENIAYLRDARYNQLFVRTKTNSYTNTNRYASITSYNGNIDKYGMILDRYAFGYLTLNEKYDIITNDNVLNVYTFESDSTKNIILPEKNRSYSLFEYNDYLYAFGVNTENKTVICKINLDTGEYTSSIDTDVLTYVSYGVHSTAVYDNKLYFCTAITTSTTNINFAVKTVDLDTLKINTIYTENITCTNNSNMTITGGFITTKNHIFINGYYTNSSSKNYILLINYDGTKIKSTDTSSTRAYAYYGFSNWFNYVGYETDSTIQYSDKLISLSTLNITNSSTSISYNREFTNTYYWLRVTDAVKIYDTNLNELTSETYPSSNMYELETRRRFW